MQEQWPLHPGMHKKHLDTSAGVGHPRAFWTEGALVLTSTVCSRPGILLGQKSSPPSRPEGVKASLTLFLGLLPLEDHFLGATRQWQHQHFLPCCHHDVGTGVIRLGTERNSSDRSQSWLFSPAVPTVSLAGRDMGQEKESFPEEGDARREDQSW